MNRQPRSWTSRYGWLIYFSLLSGALTLFFGSSFSNPPRSDYWSALYVFHQVDYSPAPPDWTSILTFDLWKHGTFRPFSHLTLYLEHKIFGANFTAYHLLNFFMYCLSIVLLYRLAVSLSLDRILAAAFLTVYAFLFTHFDIVTWTFQLFSTSSFCAFLLGFILYLRFLRSDRNLLLLLIGLLFLYGMFCSEVYVLWPLGIGLLIFDRRSRRTKCLRSFLMLGLVYLIYLVGFYFSRAAARTTGPLPHFNPGQVALALCAVSFNFFYNGIAAGLIPYLDVPIIAHYNLELGGYLIQWRHALPTIVLLGGGAGLIFLLTALILLYRFKRRHTLNLTLFFVWLGFSNYFITILARLSTNHISYSISQFRYQYIPNAMLTLMAVVLLDNLFKPCRREKIIVICALIPILIFNLCTIHGCIDSIRNQLNPLRLLLSNIRLGLKKGLINPEHKLYIDDGIVNHIPALSWNRDMAQFMRGSYQWLFSKEEMKNFTFSANDASWIIKANDYRKIYPMPKRRN